MASSPCDILADQIDRLVGAADRFESAMASGLPELTRERLRRVLRDEVEAAKVVVEGTRAWVATATAEARAVVAKEQRLAPHPSVAANDHPEPPEGPAPLIA